MSPTATENSASSYGFGGSNHVQESIITEQVQDESPVPVDNLSSQLTPTPTNNEGPSETLRNTNVSSEILAPQDSSNSTQANNSASFLGEQNNVPPTQ